MGGLVIDLRRKCLDKDVGTSDLLRHALVVARSPALEDFEKWISHELLGYQEAKEFPEYRKVKMRVMANHPAGGTVPVVFGHEETERSLGEGLLFGPVSELEYQMKSEDLAAFIIPSSIRSQFPSLRKLGGCQVFEPSEFHRIVDTVRGTILRWCLDLESEGITGEDEQFTEEQKQSAGQITFNFYNSKIGGIGPVGDTRVKSIFNQVIQEVEASSIDGAEKEEFKKLVEELRQASPTERPGVFGRVFSCSGQNYAKFGDLALRTHGRP